MMLEIGVNYNEEMLSIDIDRKNIFYGNFWDFNRPSDIFRLLDSLGIKYTLKRLKDMG